MRKLVIHGRATDDASTRVCVLYSPENGRVIHVHGVTATPGAELVSEEEMESRARKHAAGFGRTAEGAKVLHVAYSAFREHKRGFKVNAEGTGLVAI
jgi:hypothetical protein